MCHWLQKMRCLHALEEAAGLWRSLGPDSEVKHEAGPAASSWAGGALCLPWSQVSIHRVPAHSSATAATLPEASGG